jgi:hypothetical protein
MSCKVFSIDRILYEILTKSPNRAFTLHALRLEYSSRSSEKIMPPNIELFWMIYMQIYALKMANLIRREEKLEGGGVFFLEKHFEDHPFKVVDRLFVERWHALYEVKDRDK